MSSTPAVTRLVGQVVAVRDLGKAIEDFEKLGFVLATRGARHEWGIDTAVFNFADGGYYELVSSIDAEKEVGATVAAHLAKRGEGTYLASFETDDMDETYDRFVAGDVPVVGPPVPPAPSAGIEAKMLWLKPRATGSGFTQFAWFADGSPIWGPTTPDMKLFTTVYGVHELSSIRPTFETLGLEPWAEYCTDRWGLDTVVYKMSNDTNIELCAPKDASKPVAKVLADSIAKRGQGHYMTVFEVPDVDKLAARFEQDGVRTLGAPEPAPEESPWGPCRQLWVHPAQTHGAFVEFLTLPPAH